MVVGVVHKRACVLKEQGACIRGGKRTIVLPPCPLQATAISFDSFKVERENQNKTPLLFCTVKRTSSLQRGAEVWLFVSGAVRRQRECIS